MNLFSDIIWQINVIIGEKVTLLKNAGCIFDSLFLIFLIFFDTF